ncbi:MAG TPA: immunoglobulin domain-containing protein, partial [Clostridia bacterium]|nr:immunoglobulin domain-containing protein [Clostridia bacterium]
SVTAVPGQTVTLSCVAGGIPPLKFQWRKDGLPVAGATSASLTFTNVQTSQGGAYSVAVTNAYGWATSGNGVLTILPTVPLPLALNNSNQAWTVDWSVPWFGQTEMARDQAAARSYFITNGQSSSLETSVTGPGTLSFWWKVSSQPNRDFLSFRYGAVEAGNISGEVDWQQKTLYLPAGTHGLNWTYSKDATGTQGQDRAWVDQVTYVAGSTSPFVVNQPADQRSVGGSTASFQVVASGTPPLAYQWLANGVEIPGATASVYTISAPKTTDTGLYAVRITNAYGATLSANAALAVMPMAIAGDNTFGQLTIPSEATNAIALSAGSWHTLALTPSGQVLAWGNNWNGQCSVPAGLSRVIAIAAGGYHNVALKQDGTVACWGANESRQASPPAGLNRVIAIAAGSSHSLALRADGVVLAWGDNSWGQSTVPAGLGDVVAIAAGGNHNLVLRSDGTVAAWGENHNGQGGYAGQSTVPPGLAGVTAIAAGEYHSLAVKTDGTVVAWGDNSQNQCRLPTGLAQVKAVCGGGSHSVALTTSGTVLAWGANWNKQCEGVAGVVNITAVAAGSAHTLVLLDGPQVTPRLFQPERQGNLLMLLSETSSGKRCALEYKNSLADTNWTTLPAILGNGAPQFLVDRKATSPGRFYRVRQW